jgi:hypothetical protein
MMKARVDRSRWPYAIWSALVLVGISPTHHVRDPQTVLVGQVTESTAASTAAISLAPTPSVVTYLSAGSAPPLTPESTATRRG